MSAIAAGAVQRRSLAAGLLPLLIRREWQHHPWRHAVALMAVMLGVALAYSVHLINTSALAEFSGAVRAVNGEPDVVLRGSSNGLPDALFAAAANDADVQIASPVLEIDTHAKAADGRRLPLRVLGLDSLLAAPLAPDLLPHPADGADRLVIFDPGAIFLNASARQTLGWADGADVQIQSGPGFITLRVAGSIAAGGPPLLVMDLAGAQQHFDAIGRLSRIDLRLKPGADRNALLKRLQLPDFVAAVPADEGQQRLSQLSRAYRVNLTVLALVALFVGAFLVFSVVSLSVAQRTPTFALLGVLGMAAKGRRGWVLAECGLIGAAGSLLGLLLGMALAAAALRLLSGDLGGGYFPGIRPTLQVSPLAFIGFGLLGTASALVGGWWPARQAQAIAPALALKGLGTPEKTAPPLWPGLSLLAAGAAAAFAPAIGGLPLPAYAAVAALLFGGVALVPAVVHGLLRIVPPPRGALTLLAVQRARLQRRTASAAVAGVVASLALSVALTVMVTSFRSAVADWLSVILPADLYARGSGSATAAEQSWLPADFVRRAAQVHGVDRIQGQRVQAVQLAPGRPNVILLARPLADPDRDLPLLQPALPARSGETGIFVSEAIVSLYGAKPGDRLALPLNGRIVQTRVRGIWRDYARQFGSVMLADADYRALTGDARVNDLALWLKPGADANAVQAGLRALLPDPTLLEFSSTAELRRTSLRIFDRSFAVTYYLQAVAIAIGLIGVAASLSAQVLARRKEFGLLVHLGLTRTQVVAVVAGEGAAWVAAGTLVGLVLGVAVSLVLVFVVNPQSFHWTMPLVLPAGRLALLCLAVMVAGTGTAAFSARRAATRSAVLSVKEDW